MDLKNTMNSLRDNEQTERKSKMAATKLPGKKRGNYLYTGPKFEAEEVRGTATS